MSTVVRFKHPFTCTISGPTGSGKSTICVRFLQNLSYLCTEQRFKGAIFWCFSERTSIPTKELNAVKLNICFHEGVRADVENARGQPCLFILDDMPFDVYSRQVCDLFTKGNHHRKISVILFTRIYCIKPSIVETFL